MGKHITMLIALAAIIVGISACGSEGGTTTVIEQPTSTESTTTEQVSEEWPQSLQNSFIKGCGETQRCYCALDELQAQISTEDVSTSQNIEAEFKDEMMQAVQECL